MGEIIGPALLILLVLIGLAGFIIWNSNSGRQRRSLANAPALLLPDGEPPDVLLANARRVYALCQRSARLIERLQSADAITKDEDKKEAQSILDAFYSAK